ncbi:hypothetical protein [Streptomyces sp. NRRL B-24484]|uniref:hypothetical protein n=1 Tax=Streptomyces sp. NRRL B-24484 TaxID=1463833 RepID=UPI0004C164BD|nr:hypothetical protein [Streptomyces sp. NRRL B-24484]
MENRPRTRPASLTAWWLLTASAVLWVTAALGTAAYTALVLQPLSAPLDAKGRPDGEEQFLRMIDTGPALFCGLTFLLPAGLALLASARYARGERGAATLAAGYGCAHALAAGLLSSWGPWQTGAAWLLTAAAATGVLAAGAVEGLR